MSSAGAPRTGDRRTEAARFLGAAVTLPVAVGSAFSSLSTSYIAPRTTPQISLLFLSVNGTVARWAYAAAIAAATIVLAALVLAFEERAGALGRRALRRSTPTDLRQRKASEHTFAAIVAAITVALGFTWLIYVVRGLSHVAYLTVEGIGATAIIVALLLWFGLTERDIGPIVTLTCMFFMITAAVIAFAGFDWVASHLYPHAFTRSVVACTNTGCTASTIVGPMGKPTSLYFALTTLTTLGPAGITPAQTAGQVIVVVQSALGFLVLAVGAGIVLTRVTAHRRGPAQPPAPPATGQGAAFDADASGPPEGLSLETAEAGRRAQEQCGEGG